MQPIEFFLELAKQIPSTIWAAAVASVLTLTGVALSNRSNTKRLLHQLSHDSQEKHKERNATMRRDVYLRAAEEMAGIGHYLGGLPLMDPIRENLSKGLVEPLRVFAKVQLVSEPGTTELVGELTTRYSEIFLTLLGQAQPVHDLKIEIDIANDSYLKSQAEVDRTLAEMRQLNESGESDPSRYEALRLSFEHVQSLAIEFAQERQALYEQHGAALKAFTTQLMQEMRSIGPLQVRVISSIRRELRLETDISEYESRLQQNWERLDEKLAKLLDQMGHDR